jgi:hypothetical protein
MITSSPGGSCDSGVPFRGGAFLTATVSLRLNFPIHPFFMLVIIQEVGADFQVRGEALGIKFTVPQNCGEG